MKFDGTKLTARILAECGSMAAFAEKMGTDTRTAEKMAAMSVYWEVNDICRAVDVLHIEPADISAYFFTPARLLA